jgi:uncharacterized alkaline shock family protein YloU
MGIDKETPYGGINITLEAIASVAGSAASECYGVLGLASKNSLRENINELLKKDDFVKGVYCRGDRKKGYEVGVYIYVAYGVKITEVVSEVQKKVRYVLEKTFSIPFQKVDVFVQDIKDIA